MRWIFKLERQRLQYSSSLVIYAASAAAYLVLVNIWIRNAATTLYGDIANLLHARLAVPNLVQRLHADMVISTVVRWLHGPFSE